MTDHVAQGFVREPGPCLSCGGVVPQSMTVCFADGVAVYVAPEDAEHVVARAPYCTPCFRAIMNHAERQVAAGREHLNAHPYCSHRNKRTCSGALIGRRVKHRRRHDRPETFVYVLCEHHDEVAKR
jgi:hypothetical protein